MPKGQFNLDGAIKDIKNVQVNIDGSIKNIKKIQANIGGAIKDLWSAIPDVPVLGLLAEYIFENNVNDTSGNSKNATASGSPTYAVGKVGNAIVLNGSSQYARRDDLASYFIGTSSFTVACWVKTTSATQTIWHAQLESGTVGADTRVICQLSSGKIEAYRVLNGNYDDIAISAATYNDNAWHLVSVTYDGSKITLYTDAVSVVKASTKSLEGSGYAFSIGCVLSGVGAPSAYFGGAIDQMRIYNRALTASEISQLYNTGSGV